MTGGMRAAERNSIAPDPARAPAPAPTEAPDLRAPALPDGCRDDLRREAAGRPSTTPAPDRTPLGWVAWQPLRSHLERHPEDARMFTNGYHPDGSDRYVGESAKRASQRQDHQKAWVKKLTEAGMLRFDADNMPHEHLKVVNPTSYYLDPRTPASERQAFFTQAAERDQEMRRHRQEAREVRRAARLQSVAAITLGRPGSRSPNES